MTTVWPSANLSVASTALFPLMQSSSPRTGRPARSNGPCGTTLERVFPLQGAAVAIEAFDPFTARLLAMIQDMTDVIIVASLIIAACSLAVNIAAGLGERKRPFSLLRLTGVPTALLHRVVALESALPLLLVAAVSIVVGLVSAALYLHSQVGIAFSIPGITYWATVAGGLVVSLAIIASTFPLLNRITGPEVAGNGARHRVRGRRWPSVRYGRPAAPGGLLPPHIGCGGSSCGGSSGIGGGCGSPNAASAADMAP